MDTLDAKQHLGAMITESSLSDLDKGIWNEALKEMPDVVAHTVFVACKNNDGLLQQITEVLNKRKDAISGRKDLSEFLQEESTILSSNNV
jgi:hypothetical protein